MSSLTPFQPTLPAEGVFTDAEIAFIEDSPPGLFPENQNSNFGLLIRKIFADKIQQLIGQQLTLYNERFVASALDFLDQWELEVGLPVAPTGFTTAQRRSIILGRIRVGLFTRARRDEIVKAFVQATLGDAIALTPAGVPLVAAGVPIYSGLTSLAGAYTITEDIPGFGFTISVASGVSLDQVALARELDRVVPAGIHYTITVGGGTAKFASDSGHAAESTAVGNLNVSDSGTGTDWAGLRSAYGSATYGVDPYGG